MVVIFAVIFVLIAVLNIFFPAMGWRMRYGWMVKGDSGPSEAYLIMSRITSVIVLIIFFLFFCLLCLVRCVFFHKHPSLVGIYCIIIK